MYAQDSPSFETHTPNSIELDETLRQHQSGIANRCFHPQNGFVPFERSEIEQSISTRFEKQVAHDPNHLAVTTNEHAYTYDQLNRAANRIARTILERYGPEPAPVALLLEHGAPTIMAIFGVLKAGKIYVALDPAFPEARTSFIVADSQAQLIVTNQANYAAAIALVQGDESRLLNIDEIHENVADDNLNLDISPDTVAYILYTSGSTGQPKGVYQNHRNLLHEIMQYTNTLHLSPHDRFTLVYSCSVNGSLRDIFGALLIGASVHTFDVKTKGLADLAQWMQTEEITFYHSVPTVFRHFIDGLMGGENFPHLRLIRFGGERVPTQYIDWYKQYFPDTCILYAGMGATETSTTRQCFIDKETVIRDSVVPTGYAVDERPILLLDENGRPVPEGEVGTITVKSHYLALGYWRRPDLTEEKFRPDPDGSGARLYLTGDLGRILADGRLIHMGREDAQVKIRGHRVELAEIEQALLKHPGIKEAAVAAHPDGQNGHYLAAYAVTHPGQNVTTTELYKFFKKSVPDYMMPAAFMFLQQMPLTPNSKVDRKSLPVPQLTRPTLATPFEPPTTAVETELANIWSGILRVDPIGILDNFFELGGHSLSATQVISRLQERFQITVPFHTFFADPTIAALAQQINQASASAADTQMPRLPRAAHGSTILPASYSQQRLWFLEQLDPGKATFNLPLVLVLNGRLHTDTLHQAINQLVARHETLRTTFLTEEGTLYQCIQPPKEVPLTLEDLQHLPLAEREQRANEQLYTATYRTFDLVNGPLLRVTLYRLSETEHWLLIAMHHIITDGWSVGLMQAELTELYRAAVTGQEANLPELPAQYADFAAWQHNWLTTPEATNQLNYWKQQLTDLPSALALPTDHPRPVQATGQGAQRRFDLPANLVQQLKKFSQTETATPYMTLLTTLLALLHRYTGQDDLVVGTTIANRTRADIEPLIGFFLNSLVLRTDLSGQPTFRELLSRVRQTTLDAFANQQIPVEKLIESLNPSRRGHNLPLFQVLFIYQNMPRPALDWPELKVTRRRLDLDVTKFDLTLTVIEQDNGLQCLFEYNSDLFEAATIERLFGQMQTLLSSVVEAPTTAVSHLPLLTHPQIADLLALAEGPTLPEPPFTAVPQWFEAQVEQSVGKTAVTHQERSITYGELNQRANQLAHYLQKQGVTRNSIVGLCLNRSIEMLVGLWGILKAGGAYLPLDPAYPAERLALMLDDAQVQTVVTQANLVTLLPQAGTTFTCLDQDWPQIAQEPTENLKLRPEPEDLAYVIYTSGSTGKPKGVKIPHRALTHFTQAASHLYNVTANDRVLQFATINFDAAVEEIFPALVQEATLCLRTEEMLNSMDAFLAQATAYNITLLDLPTAFWHQLVVNLAEDGLSLPPSLRLLIIGGEKASGPKVADWHRLVGDQVRLFNTYGPTEVTVVATAYELPAEGAPQLVSQGMPIGRALANGQALVLDAYQQPVPVGMPGELVFGGPQVALGYLHRPELTTSVFIPHPFREGETVYRTGDQVRWLPDGNLEFLGRVDYQVKIRGFRIEPGEIEAVLVRETAVKQAIVLPQTDAQGEMQLIAYVVPNADSVTAAGLRAAIQAELPPYMVPAAFVLLDEIPLTANGKVNKRALPTEFDFSSERTVVPPRNNTEATLVHIWQALLGVTPIGIHDSFFELGGHSLSAMQMVYRLRDALAVSLPLRTLFEQPTIAQLAQVIAQHQPEQELLRPFHRPKQLPLSFAQQRIWILDQIQLGNPATNITAIYHLHGPLKVAALNHSLTALTARHEILRTRFVLVDNVPVQRIDPATDWSLEQVDLRHLPAEQQTIQVDSQIEAARAYPFNLSDCPLFLTRLLCLNDNKHVLILVTDHIISDGWSMSRIAHDLSELYAAQHQNRTANLPPLPVQYADYTLWQQQWLQSNAAQQQLAYWQKQLAEAPPALELPTDHPRPAQQTFNGAILKTTVDESVTAVLKQIGGQTDATLFMTLLAAFKLLLSRQTGTTDIVVGTPTAGRSQPEIENLVGIFLNNLVLRTDLSGNPTFRDLLTRVRQTALDAYSHQDLPFEPLLDVLAVERDLSRTPLFQVMFNMLNLADSNLHLPHITAEKLFPINQESNFDMTLYVGGGEHELRLQLVYNTDLFDEARMTALLAQFKHLLGQIAAQPDQPLANFSLVTPQIRPLLPDPRTPLPPQWTAPVHELVQQQAQRQPNKVALQDSQIRWTYGELEQRSNQLAHVLRTQGIRNEDVVAIHATRSAALVWAMLGVLKAGAAFMLLDAAYPPARLRSYLETAVPRGFIHLQTTAPLPGELADWLAQAALACNLTLPQTGTAVPAPISQQPTTSPDVSVGPDDLAYLLFTSGTTGQPKGILGRHSPLSHFFPWQINTFGLTTDDRFSLLSGLSHDPLLRDIFTPLLAGATLHIPTQETLIQPGELANWLAKNQISVAHLTPPLAQVIALAPSAPALPTLRYTFFGGDRLTGQAVQTMHNLNPAMRCVNFYGATETPQAMAYHLIQPEEVADINPDQIVPLGQGIEGVQLLVAQTNGRLCGVGELGEIYVRTPYLSKGYLQAADQTEAHFLTSPVTQNPADRWYRTGDLGRYLPDGQVVFAGRADRQLKIRGFRIEPAEVEGALKRLPAVDQCYVTVWQDTAVPPQLVAYVVGSAIDSESLRASLSATLPDYMIPTAFVALDHFPLTPNGKLDTAQLPAPDLAQNLQQAAYAPPRNALENTLVNIWENVLDVEPIDIHDNYFRLGGHSLQTIALFAQINQTLGQQVPLAVIFEAPTIAKLAAAILAKGQTEDWSVVVPISPSGSKRPFFCVHGGAGHVYHFRALAHHLEADQPFYGLQPRARNTLSENYANIKRMAIDYVNEIRAVQPHGPYYLGGFCFGGIVAFEMAQQLSQMGEPVALVAIIDTLSPNFKATTATPTPANRPNNRWQRHATALRRQAGWQNKLAYIMNSLKGRRNRLVSSFEHLKKKAQRRLDHIQIRWYRFLKRPLPLDLHNLHMLEMNRQARKQYQPVPYAGDLTVFRQYDHEDDDSIPHHQGWASLTTQTVHVYDIEGKHLALLQEPKVQELAQHLQASLHASQARHETA